MSAWRAEACSIWARARRGDGVQSRGVNHIGRTGWPERPWMFSTLFLYGWTPSQSARQCWKSPYLNPLQGLGA